MQRTEIAITGAGLITSLGAGKTENWAALTQGRSGIRRIGRFPVEGLKTTIAGTVDFVLEGDFFASDLSLRLAEIAIEEAVGEARIGRRGDFPGPLFIAVPPVEIEWGMREAVAGRRESAEPIPYASLFAMSGERRPAFHDKSMFGRIATEVAARFGTKGSPISLSTACASGATAIQLAVEAIRRGETEAALVAATDGSIQPEALIRFSLLSALSTRNEAPEAASRPFSKERDGFVMAEGAAALVLESLEAAKARGAPILGIVAGCGERVDAFHRTRSSPDGAPIIGAIRAALADARLEPGAIDYINAHGTSTPENDKMEALGIGAVFGERAPPTSSNKSMIGHTLTAAGAIEAVFSLLTIREGLIPPTINHDLPDPAIALDVVPNVARPARIERVLSNSFGFGGQNVCLVLAAEPG